MTINNFQQEIIDVMHHMLQTMTLRDDAARVRLLETAKHSPEIFYNAIHDAYDMACGELGVLLDILERNLRKEESSKTNNKDG